MSLCRLNSPALICRLSILFFFISFASAPSPLAAELPSSKKYFYEVWQTEQGLPHNNVFSLAQTGDGQLWLATSRGLTRFDGLQFSLQPIAPNGAATMSGIRRVATDQAGRLWIGPESGGLGTLADSSVRWLETREGVYRSRFFDCCFDKEDNIWTVNLDGEVDRIAKGTVAHFGRLGRGMVGPPGLAIDAEGNVWLASNSTLGRFQGTNWTELLTDLPVPLAIAPRRSGGIWLVTNERLLQVSPAGAVTEMTALPWPPHDADVRQVFEDHHGAVWLATNRRGLLRYGDGKLESVPTPHASILCLAEDRERNLWVGTQGGGVCRLREKEFFVHDSGNGLPNDIVHSVAQDLTGRVWIVTQDGGLSWLTNGVCHPLGATDGWPSTVPLCVTPDATGGIWVGTFSEGLIHWRDGQATRWKKEKGIAGQRINCLLNDRAGRLWIGYDGEGVGCLVDGRVHHYGQTNGVPGGFVRVITEDALGRIWVGTAEGSIARFVNDHFEAALPQIGGGGIQSILHLENGTMLAGTAANGLLWLKQGSPPIYLTLKQGLPDNSILQMALDDLGQLWCGTPRGLFRISLRELNAVADGRSPRLQAFKYGRSDGLADFQFGNLAQPGTWRARDGRLWFATAKGAVTFTPERMSVNHEPPPVLIESFSADDKFLNFSQPVILPGNTRAVEFHFSALSFTAPDKVRFRHRLQGWDVDWIETGTKRQAQYRDLPPGNYRFQVIACNNDGVWNELGTALSFQIIPMFWQTRWFSVLAVALTAGLVGAAYRVATVRRLRSRVEKLRAQNALEMERTRIAQDIHDELGASLTQIGMLAGLAAKELDRPAAVHADLQRIAATSNEAVRAMDAIVWAINPHNDSLENFVAYISRFAESFLPAAGIRFRLEAPPDLPARPLGTEQRHQLFLVVREALNNIVRHAHAHKVRIRLAERDGLFHLTIEDDGRGLPATEPGAGSDGLANMRQRILGIGGRFDTESKPGAGTRIIITVPLADTVANPK